MSFDGKLIRDVIAKHAPHDGALIAPASAIVAWVILMLEQNGFRLRPLPADLTEEVRRNLEGWIGIPVGAVRLVTAEEFPPEAFSAMRARGAACPRQVFGDHWDAEHLYRKEFGPFLRAHASRQRRKDVVAVLRACCAPLRGAAGEQACLMDAALYVTERLLALALFTAIADDRALYERLVPLLARLPSCVPLCALQGGTWVLLSSAAP